MGLHMGGCSAELKRLAPLHIQWKWLRRSGASTLEKDADKAMGGTGEINGILTGSRQSVGQTVEVIEKASSRIVLPFLCFRVAAPKMHSPIYYSRRRTRCNWFWYKIGVTNGRPD